MPTTVTLNWDSNNNEFSDDSGDYKLRYGSSSLVDGGLVDLTDSTWLLDRPGENTCVADIPEEHEDDEDCDAVGDAPGSVNEAFKSPYVGTQDDLDNAEYLYKNDQFIKCLDGRYSWFKYIGNTWDLSNTTSPNLNWNLLGNGLWEIEYFPEDCSCGAGDEEEEGVNTNSSNAPAGVASMGARSSIDGNVTSSLDPISTDLNWSCGDITLTSSAGGAGDPHIKPILGKPYTI